MVDKTADRPLDQAPLDKLGTIPAVACSMGPIIISCGGGGGGGTPAPAPIALISVNLSGTPGDGQSNLPSVSDDGRYVAFESVAADLVAGDGNGWVDIFLHDTQAGITSRVSVSTAGTEGNDGSVEPVISGDGRYVAFYGDAQNFTPGDTNGYRDVFVRDTQMNITSRVSVSTMGTEGNHMSQRPSISADGRHVVFASQS